MKHLIRTGVSGVLVYVMAAACSAADGTVDQSTTDGGENSGGRYTGVLDAFIDSMSSPIREANAEPEPRVADVATEKCDKASNTFQLFAVHLYPGKTIAELAKVVAICHPGAREGGPPKIEGHTFPAYQLGNVRLSDGAAAIQCGNESATMCDSVTFVLPP